jgi:uracil-DNA glycosylase
LTDFTTTWETLEAVHRQMDGCRLCLEAGFQITSPAVYSGASGAKIMIVGQAPGITECQAGRPFNAGSGTRLFAWLAGAGIEEDWFRHTQYMTSITKCYPGKASGGSGDRVPSRREQALCRPYLEGEIEFVDPELIIPVGRLAIGRFFPANPPLEEIVGTRARIDGRWNVPLPHPSGASRWHQIPANRERIETAVRLIRETVEAVIAV